jgi:hypothetical protein
MALRFSGRAKLTHAMRFSTRYDTTSLSLIDNSSSAAGAFAKASRHDFRRAERTSLSQRTLYAWQT